jgi:serine phosphatase RsbU (regulator of sigma subunit)
VGEALSGDAAVVRQTEEFVFLALIDVLGHGPDAYVTARQAREYLASNWQPDVMQTMINLHKDLGGTRGAAAGIGSINLATGQLSYCAVGNIVARKIGRRSLHLTTTEGIVGHSMNRLSPETTVMESSDLLVLFSDGIPDRFSVEELAGLQSRDAWGIARHLVKEYGKPYDDATCIALRYQR